MWFRLRPIERYHYTINSCINLKIISFITRVCGWTTHTCEINKEELCNLYNISVNINMYLSIIDTTWSFRSSKANETIMWCSKIISINCWRIRKFSCSSKASSTLTMKSAGTATIFILYIQLTATALTSVVAPERPSNT